MQSQLSSSLSAAVLTLKGGFALWLVFGAIAATPSLAQITPDGTTSTDVTATDTGVRIDSGDRAGDNLFHSFDEFSVPSNSEAFFNNASDIVNIFSRVTGGNISNIDGILRANGAANLFLINPAGIVLGENARLQLGGSFYGSTADSIIFPDGEFSATDLENPPLITINAPIGLGFRDNPASITVRGNGNGSRDIDSEVIDTQEALRVDTDAVIGLIGGELVFEGATLKTAGGSIEIGSIAGGEVDLVATANGFTFDYSGVDSFRDISLVAQSNIDASGLGGGNIRVRGNNITLTDKSTIGADTLGEISGGRVEIFATENLTITGNDPEIPTAIGSQVLPTGTGDGGDVTIEAQNLTVNGFNAFIATATAGGGKAGDINLKVTENILLEGTSISIFNGVLDTGTNDGGEIDITTNSLSLANGAIVNTATLGQGNGGNVIINATEEVSLDGGDSIAAIFTGTLTGSIGNGGTIDITTGSLTVENAATLNTITSGDGNAGNVIINATDKISFNGGGNTNGIFAGSFSPTTGRSGNIELNANSITLNETSFNNASDHQVGDIELNATENISLANDSTLFAVGADRGSITIEAQNLELTDSRLFAGITSESGSLEAQTGDITINLTEDFLIDRQSRIFNQNLGIGNAGNITIKARNISFLNGSQISNSNIGEGNIGDTTLNATGNITLLDGSQINNTNQGQGNIGNITLNAGGEVTLDSTDNESQRSQISQFVLPEAIGNVGKISLQSQNLTITNMGQIQSLVAGTANSGDIEVDVADTIIIDGFGELIFGDGTSGVLPSQIGSETAPTARGDSGNINISTRNLFLSRNGTISSSTFGRGNAGNIDIDASAITIGEQGNPDLLPSKITSQALSGINDSLAEANSGNITINTDSLSIRDGGGIDVGIGSIGNGGNISITATENVTIDGTGILGTIENSPSAISATVSEIGVANGGNIEIRANNVSVTNQGQLNTSNAGRGNAGTISIDVTDTFFADNRSLINSNIGTSENAPARGNVGNIIINAEQINLSGTAQIQAGAFSGATAEQPGIVSLTATESISFTGENTGIFSNNDPGSSGDASDTSLSASTIKFDAGAVISANNQSDGRGGNVTIAAERLALSNNSGIFANVSGRGDAGSIAVNATDSVLLTELSSIEVGVLSNSTGNGGNLTVDTNTLTLRDGSQIFAGVLENTIGNGGNISVDSNLLTLSEGSQISAITFGEGNAGSLEINVSESIDLSGTQAESRGGLFANALVSSGQGGDIFVSTDKLTLRDGATITASNFSSLGASEPGTGEAGNLRVEVNSVTLSNEARIDTATRSGNGGNISFEIADTLTLRENSFISARALNNASGGNIDIDTKFILAFPSQFDGNDIRADAEQGRGGNISITAESVLGIAERTLNPLTNDINASSQVAGLSGTIAIDTPDINPLRTRAELPTNLVATNIVATNVCEVSTTGRASNLIVNGKGGVAPEIINPLTADNLIIDRQATTLNPLQTNPTSTENSPLTQTIPPEIQPAIVTKDKGKLYAARGIIRQEDGTVYLTAYPTTYNSRTIAVLPLDCTNPTN